MPDATPCHCHALFDTAIGTCGIAWGPGGIVAVQLPEADAEATRARLLRSHSYCAQSGEPPATVRSAIEGIQALLATDVGLGLRRDHAALAQSQTLVSHQLPVRRTLRRQRLDPRVFFRAEQYLHVFGLARHAGQGGVLTHQGQA